MADAVTTTDVIGLLSFYYSAAVAEMAVLVLEIPAITEIPSSGSYLFCAAAVAETTASSNFRHRQTHKIQNRT